MEERANELKVIREEVLEVNEERKEIGLNGSLEFHYVMI